MGPHSNSYIDPKLQCDGIRTCGPQDKCSCMRRRKPEVFIVSPSTSLFLLDTTLSSMHTQSVLYHWARCADLLSFRLPPPTATVAAVTCFRLIFPVHLFRGLAQHPFASASRSIGIAGLCHCARLLKNLLRAKPCLYSALYLCHSILCSLLADRYSDRIHTTCSVTELTRRDRDPQGLVMEPETLTW